MSRVLLVTPTFHGYWRSIADALGRRDHEVSTHRYDEFRTLPAKVRNKLRYELPARLGRDGHSRMVAELTPVAAAAVREHRPDVVVVVKGDLLGDAFWDAVAPIPSVVWVYDELRRMYYADETLARVGPIASYSGLDTAELQRRGLPATHLHLAYDPHLAVTDPRTRNDELVFVGARYPRREQSLLALTAAGLPVRAFGKDWSHHPLDRARTWTVARPDLPWGRELSRQDSYREMAAAAGALNIHGDQDGFTMRTFEASGVGGVQLVDRADVAGLYDVGEELLAFGTDEDLVELAGRARTDTAWSDRIRERGRARTLAEHTFDHRIAVLEALWA